MELAIGASLAGVGYLLNRDKERQVDVPQNRNNNQQPGTFSRSVEQQQVSSQIEKSRTPLESNVIPPDFNQDIHQVQQPLQTVQFVARPDATRTTPSQSTPIESLQMGASQRSFNPPGLQPSSRENFVSQLSGQTMNQSDFTHNNMVPFFGSRVRQNVEGGGGNQARLEAFTGIPQNDIKHEEIQPMFKPEKNMSHIFGTPNTNDVMMDRYTPSRMRTNEAPMDKIYVGPGLNQGYESRPTGGFHQDTRDYALPKTTDELRVKTNPKQSYEGRILPGQGINKRGQVGKIRKNNPDRFYLQGQDRWIKTTGAVKGKKLRAPIVDKHTNRQDTSCKNYSGPAGSVDRKKAPKPGLFRKSRNQNYRGSGPRNAVAPDQWKNTRQADYGRSTMEVVPTERQTTESRNPLSNVTSIIKAITAPVEDIFKTTRKENFVGSVRPTGNLQYSGPKKQTIYDPNDVARTTIKETNVHNEHEGNLRGPTKLIAYDPADYARTTIKETNIHDNRTGPLTSHAYKVPVYDPNDTTRTTIKETNIHDVRTGNMSSQASNLPDGSKRMGVVHDPDDKAVTTVRETLPNQDPTVNMGRQAPAVPPVKDPTDVTRTTIKETNIHDNRVGNVTGLDNQEGYSSNPKVAPNTNRQSTSDYEYMGHADGDVGKGGGKGYMTNKKEAPNTNRQSTSDYEYSGIADGPEQPKSYGDVYNATLNEVKEELSQGRMPTVSGTKTPTGGNMINVQVDKLETDRVNHRKLQGDRVSQVIQNVDQCTFTTGKNQVPNQPINERIDPNVLEVFEKNPYTQPLNSAPTATYNDPNPPSESAINSADSLQLPAREEEDQIAEARRLAMEEWQAQQ